MDPMKGEPMDPKALDQFKTDVMGAVDETLATQGASKNAMIDALVDKLEAMKDQTGPAMGGMGSQDEPMNLGEAEPAGGSEE